MSINTTSPANIAAFPPQSAGFKALADLITQFPTLATHSHFLFVPGPTDPWSASVLPQPAIPDSFVAPVLAKVPKARFTTNPCRLRYFGQEIVIMREDLMSRMLRNLVIVKESVQGEEMKRFVGMQTVGERRRGAHAG